MFISLQIWGQLNIVVTNQVKSLSLSKFRSLSRGLIFFKISEIIHSKFQMKPSTVELGIGLLSMGFITITISLYSLKCKCVLLCSAL